MEIAARSYIAYICEVKLNPEEYPNLSYFNTMKDWQEFVNRTPEEYERWIYGNSRELVEFEITYLIHVSKDRKVIVDTNIPPDILSKIADYNQVAVMLSPQSMSVDCFFERNDPEKVFLKEQVKMAENPEKTMANFLEGIARVNSEKYYEEFLNSGFFVTERKDVKTDTRFETLDILAKHFGLTD